MDEPAFHFSDDEIHGFMARYLSLLVLILFIPQIGQAQVLENQIPCVYGFETGELRGFRANDYCSDHRTHDISAVARYMQKVEDSFWERAWIASAYRIQGASLSASDSTLHPFIEVDISLGLEEWARGDRIELDGRARDFLARLHQGDRFLSDDALADYLGEQLRAVVPNPMMPGRPGSFRILVLKAGESNAYVLSDGTIIITAGLLASVNDPEQLQGVLAHEVAHVLLDHHVESLRKSETRRMWADVVGTIASAVAREVAWEVAGRLGASVGAQFWLAVGADLSTRYITAEIVEAIGMRFSRSQEAEADRLAQLWILEHDVRPDALISAISASRYDTVSVSGHPSLDDRRRDLKSLTVDLYGRNAWSETPDPGQNVEYASIAAPAVLYLAQLARTRGDWATTDSLARRVRTFAPDTSEVYGTATYLSAQARRLRGSERSDIWSLLADAEEVGGVPVGYIDLERAMLYVADGDSATAASSFQRALDAMLGSDAYPHAIADWAEQMVVMLR